MVVVVDGEIEGDRRIAVSGGVEGRCTGRKRGREDWCCGREPLEEEGGDKGGSLRSTGDFALIV